MHTNNDRARAVNFQVSESEYRALRMHAAQNGTTTRAVLRGAIEQLTRLGTDQPSSARTQQTKGTP